MEIKWKNCFRVGLSIFVLYLCIVYWQFIAGALSKFFGATVPLLAGFAICYVINILMCFYEQKVFAKVKKARFQKFRRPVCIVLAVLTLIAIIAIVAGLVVPQLVSCVKLIVSMLPGAINSWVAYFHTLPSIPENVIEFMDNIDAEKMISQGVELVTSGFGNVMDTVLKAATSVVSGTVTTFLSIIFAIYLLVGKDTLIAKADRMFNHYMPDKFKNKIYYILRVFNESFHKYIVGQCLEAVILGVLCTLGMMLLRLPYSAMIGALVAFTALIPVAGAYIGAIVGAFMILMVSPVKALVFLIFLVILQQLEGNLIYPKVVGNSLGLPSILVLAAVTIGGGLAGIPGMLLGVPITAAIYRIIKDDMNK